MFKEKNSLGYHYLIKIQVKVLAIAIIFSLVLSLISTSFVMQFMNYDVFTRDYFYLISVLRWIISPLLIFVTFYFIGKRIDTTKKFWSYLFSFFLGNCFGSTFGTIVTFIFSDFVDYTQIWYLVARLVGTFIGSLFSYAFFVGFCALATSYITRKGQTENVGE